MMSVCLVLGCQISILCDIVCSCVSIVVCIYPHTFTLIKGKNFLYKLYISLKLSEMLESLRSYNTFKSYTLILLKQNNAAFLFISINYFVCIIGCCTACIFTSDYT